nr:Unknown Function [uncultured bacterium]
MQRKDTKNYHIIDLDIPFEEEVFIGYQLEPNCSYKFRGSIGCYADIKLNFKELNKGQSQDLVFDCLIENDVEFNIKGTNLTLCTVRFTQLLPPTTRMLINDDVTVFMNDIDITSKIKALRHPSGVRPIGKIFEVQPRKLQPIFVKQDRFFSCFAFFYPSLKDEDKLSLRLVNKANYKNLHDHQHGPYKTKTEFIIGIGGIFYDKVYLEKAWYVYHTTVTSTSSLPAIIYKRKDIMFFNITGFIKRFAQNEDLEATGRIYSPGDRHTWEVNQVWMLAQIHIKRGFAICSNVNLKNVMRYESFDRFSAFAKEIATAIKAGYTIYISDDITDGKKIFLNPPKKDNMANKFTFEAIHVSDDEIKLNIETVHKAEKNWKKYTF